jgi:hypothetical protein
MRLGARRHHEANEEVDRDCIEATAFDEKRHFLPMADAGAANEALDRDRQIADESKESFKSLDALDRDSPDMRRDGLRAGLSRP